jgi:hypothetical protein
MQLEVNAGGDVDANGEGRGARWQRSAGQSGQALAAPRRGWRKNVTFCLSFEHDTATDSSGPTVNF